MKQAPNVPTKRKNKSLIKVATSDTDFKTWAKSSGIATSSEIDAMPRDRLLKLYDMYSAQLTKGGAVPRFSMAK